MKTLVLDNQTQLNAILVVDKKNSQTFHSQDINMSLEEYLERCQMMVLVNNTPTIPNILNKKLSFQDEGVSNTSTGVPFHSTMYDYEDDKIIIAVNVIDWIGDLVDSEI
jgi:hypothetical protein